MTLLVPFDGSDLSSAALRRAVEFSSHTGESVLALSVVPREPEYARENGWIEPGQSFDPERIAGVLEKAVEHEAPEAAFRYEVPEETSSIASTTTDVARTIRQVAHEVAASIVFVGSENAGRVSTPLCSVGAPISQDPTYDVHIVRHVE